MPVHGRNMENLMKPRKMKNQNKNGCANFEIRKCARPSVGREELEPNLNENGEETQS